MVAPVVVNPDIDSNKAPAKPTSYDIRPIFSDATYGIAPKETIIIQTKLTKTKASRFLISSSV